MENSIKFQSNNLASSAQNNGDFEDYHSSTSSPENHLLVSQILELRRRLDEDHQSYKRKLEHYQESQQKQAQLVAKLQQKVTQYKNKCNDLELNLESRNSELERLRNQQAAIKSSTEENEIDNLMARVEEEQQKYLPKMIKEKIFFYFIFF